jgi:hypothetical protein
MNSKALSTQNVKSVVELLNFFGKNSDPLPEAVLLDSVMLVLSNKKDAYYVTTAKSCSCPSSSYRPCQRCKHQLKHFSEKDIKRQSITDVVEEHDRNLPRMPASYRRIVKAAREEAEADLELKPKGSFKPFLEG